MQWNYRREQLREIKLEQGCKFLDKHLGEKEKGQHLTTKILNFQDPLSEKIARMLQHAY
jgi:hypothetical protein